MYLGSIEWGGGGGIMGPITCYDMFKLCIIVCF